jgi:excisionase family DNA binding protein
VHKRESNNQPLLNVQEVAHRLNLAVPTIYKMVNQRRIPYVKIGGALKFDLAALDEWIKESTVMPMPVR